MSSLCVGVVEDIELQFTNIEAYTTCKASCIHKLKRGRGKINKFRSFINHTYTFQHTIQKQLF